MEPLGGRPLQRLVRIVALALPGVALVGGKPPAQLPGRCRQMIGGQPPPVRGSCLDRAIVPDPYPHPEGESTASFN